MLQLDALITFRNKAVESVTQILLAIMSTEIRANELNNAFLGSSLSC